MSSRLYQKNAVHIKRMRAIRKYVDFDYKARDELTAYDKRKIKQYYDEINALTARPYHVYRPRGADTKKLAKAQKFSQHEKRLKGLKVAFVPTNGEDRPRIRFDKKGDIISSTKHITTRYIELDTKRLVSDTDEYIKEVVEESQAKSYTILAGRYEIPVGYAPRTLIRGINRLAMKYGDNTKNNYFANWMHGLSAHNFKVQKEFNEYNIKKMEAKSEIKRKRRAAKERARYAKEKGRS